MAAPRHHQTNGQAERRIWELKTALRNIINLRQTSWLTSLPEVRAYSNAGYSDVINMSPYKAVYGREYPLLDTHPTYPSAVPASDDYYNRHQEIRNAAYQALKLARARSMSVAVMESTIVATIHCPDVGYCLFGILPSNAYSLLYFLYLPYCYSFLLGSTFLCSLIYFPRPLYPIRILYASYYVLLD